MKNNNDPTSLTGEVEDSRKDLDLPALDRDSLLKEFVERSLRAEFEVEEWKKKWTTESMLRENLQLRLTQLQEEMARLKEFMCE